MTVTQNVFSQHITHQTPSQTRGKLTSCLSMPLLFKDLLFCCVFLLHVINPSYHVFICEMLSEGRQKVTVLSQYQNFQLRFDMTVTQMALSRMRTFTKAQQYHVVQYQFKYIKICWVQILIWLCIYSLIDNSDLHFKKCQKTPNPSMF